MRHGAHLYRQETWYWSQVGITSIDRMHVLVRGGAHLYRQETSYWQDVGLTSIDRRHGTGERWGSLL